jgi:ElaB/YqjD/DUF883 family membrane-anchored ribosome-binding protein
MQGDPKAATETSPSEASPSDLASTARGLLEKPIATGVDFVEGLARSARGFADDIDGEAPKLATMVRRAANRAEDLSHDIRDKSIEEIVETAQDFARRQPALFIGVAATAGFLLARFVKTGMSGASSSRSGSGLSAAGAPAPTPPAQQSARTFHDA